MSGALGVALRWAVLAGYAFLAVQTFRRWRQGGPTREAAGWLSASFLAVATAALAGIVWAGQLGPDDRGHWPWKVTVAIMLAFPYCLARFTDSFQAGRWRPLRLCTGLSAVSIAWTLALPATAPGGHSPLFRPYALVVLVGWTLISGLAAAWLWNAAPHEATVARRRMRTLSLGSILVNVAVVVRVLALPSAPLGTQLAMQVFGLVSAWLFFAGFRPLGSFGRCGAKKSFARFHQAQAGFIGAFDANSVGQVAVTQAARLFGAHSAFLTDADGTVLAVHGIAPADATLEAGIELGVVVEPVGGGWLVLAASPVTPLFGAAELELLRALCNSAGLALERAELFARDEANRLALEQRESQLAQAQQLASLGSWEWHPTSGRIVWSAEMYRLYDVDPAVVDAAVDYRWFQERSHPDDTGALEEVVSDAIATGGRFEISHRIIASDGQVRWLHSRGRAVLGGDGETLFLQGTAQDVTASKESEERLRARARQQAALAQFSQRALRDDPATDLYEDAAQVVASVLAVADEAPTTLGPSDLDFLTSVANVLAAAVERQHSQTLLAHQALHDPLTGLANRVLLLDRLAQATARSGRNPRPVTVLFLDLDRFKVVNDGLGHRAGDGLKVVAERLVAVVRPADTVARLGGDEFVILCEDMADEAEAAGLAQRVAAALERPVPISGREVTVTVSIGIVVADAATASPETLLRDADTAMYEAKERGRARFELFDRPARQRVMERLDTEMALRGALGRDELALVYQPVVALNDGRTIGCEALLRWRRPGRPAQLPGEFLPLAEETGLIVPIGEWGLLEACRAGAALQHRDPGRPPMVMWVNLSARQLVQPGLTETIIGALAETGLPPVMLGLEITESVLMEETGVSGETLRKLKRLGVRVAIDDFGTGFSSLSWLRRFPVDVLKIDRSFIAGVDRPGDDTAIVEAVISLARSLGMTTVAEGVESSEQAATLLDLGCDAAQGYLFSPPVDGAALAALVGQCNGTNGPASGLVTTWT